MDGTPHPGTPPRRARHTKTEPSLQGLPWQLRGSTLTRCAAAALILAAPFTFIAVDAGRSATYSTIVFLLAASAGTCIGLLLSVLKRRLLSPGPHGVTRLRVRQMTAEGRAPRDPAERAALRASLTRSRPGASRATAAASWAIIGVFFVGSLVLWVVQREWGWLITTLIIYPLVTVMTVLEQRKERRTHQRLLAYLDPAQESSPTPHSLR